jgi:NADH dehydrogenase
MGVEIHVSTVVDSYDGKTIHFKNHEPIDAFTVEWSAGVTSASSRLKTEWLERGRILTDEHCAWWAARIFCRWDIALMKIEISKVIRALRKWPFKWANM